MAQRSGLTCVANTNAPTFSSMEPTPERIPRLTIDLNIPRWFWGCVGAFFVLMGVAGVMLVDTYAADRLARRNAEHANPARDTRNDTRALDRTTDSILGRR